MSKSIYEEALHILKEIAEIERLIAKIKKVKDMIEQAKKQEKLLELYQKLYKIPCIISTLDEQLEIEKLIKELEDDK